MNKKQDKIKAKVKKQKLLFLDLAAMNYMIFGVAVLTIILGYVSLSKGPADSFWSLTLAPILLVIGYCILVPLAIFWRSKKPKNP
ncbi:hypothetical protein JXQ31_16340 [candidate division KSB1 bacterium]|nr:hypothetical protein [candidate division KSB1 bacterium]